MYPGGHCVDGDVSGFESKSRVKVSGSTFVRRVRSLGSWRQVLLKVSRKCCRPL